MATKKKPPARKAAPKKTPTKTPKKTPKPKATRKVVSRSASGQPVVQTAGGVVTLNIAGAEYTLQQLQGSPGPLTALSFDMSLLSESELQKLAAFLEEAQAKITGAATGANVGGP